MNKKGRLEKIKRFVTEYEVGTQDEIVEHLKELGISATQATVSRDIKELGIVKIPLQDNTYIYELPKSAVSAMSLAENNILDSEIMGNMINLKLVPGTTAFVKKKIMASFDDEIFSLIYDDDSMLIILYDKERASTLVNEIKNL
ncbi:arginine repressor [Streptococcus massiliensis]|uniref:Arginine repressor n=1 Tax=Streptococcus massiliensis TaxID=313439 RepID=A0A380KX71_9STRE|nr:hypothetical protein [Streptococcus massiliensis]SUN75687.1 ArgR family transcriptional regulator [Streptococcus massiliensis]